MASKLRSGFGEVQKAVERQQASFTPVTGKLNYFSLEKDEIKFVRFIDDQVITAKFYEWLMNNQGKTNAEFIHAPDLYQYDDEWKGRDWVKQWTSATPGIGWQKPFGKDELVEPKLVERTVGIAVQQEPDRDAEGNVIPNQYRDVLEEIEVDGEKYISLHFMIVRQALSNFWDQMIGYGGLYGTICDRVYRIQRTGEGFKTKYNAIGLNPDPGWEYGDPNSDEPGPSLKRLQEYYGYGVKVTKAEGDNVDADNPDGYTWANRYLYCPTTVAEWAERRASEEYAKYWLDPNAEHLKDKKPETKGVTAEELAKSRPADPRAGGAANTPAAVPPPPATEPVTTPAQNLDTPGASTTETAAAAAPPSGDRFEQMRADMAKRQEAAST